MAVRSGRLEVGFGDMVVNGGQATGRRTVRCRAAQDASAANFRPQRNVEVATRTLGLGSYSATHCPGHCTRRPEA